MRTSFPVIVCVTLACATAFSAGDSPNRMAAGDPHMTVEERSKLVRILNESREECLSAIENLTEAQWGYRPSSFEWSVGLVAEHILLTERALFTAMERALASQPNPDWESKTAGKAQFIEKVMPNGTRQAQAPIEVRPTGKMSREDVIRQFKEMRARTSDFAAMTELPLKAHTYDHPFPVFNTLSAFDWLLYIPLHNQRHNKQIAEVKASPGFPR